MLFRPCYLAHSAPALNQGGRAPSVTRAASLQASCIVDLRLNASVHTDSPPTSTENVPLLPPCTDDLKLEKLEKPAAEAPAALPEVSDQSHHSVRSAIACGFRCMPVIESWFLFEYR